MRYNWERPDWPNFEVKAEKLVDLLVNFTEQSLYVNGLTDGLSPELAAEVNLQIMVSEAIKTSEIEGEYLSRADVMSSIKNNLGFSKVPVGDKRAEGISNLIHDVRQTVNDKLTEQKLYEWHTMLFSYLGSKTKLAVGSWRTHNEPMQVVSGQIDKPKIHFEAPPSRVVHLEMRKFIKWFNDRGNYVKNPIHNAAIHSAVSHLYFESIHPFEDGNGRIGRAISDKALAQGFGKASVVSVSQVIEANKKDYYSNLSSAQRSNEITDWVSYFVSVISAAYVDSKSQIELIVRKAKFFDQYSNKLNDRQSKVLRRMLRDLPFVEFEGGMNARKYIGITSVSKATATRDLQYLEQLGVLKRIGNARSTRYQVNI